MQDQMPQQAAGQDQQGQEPAIRTEVALCVYGDGTMALKLDGGEKVPVESLDQALAAIQKIASEGGEEEPGAGATELMGDEPEGEEAFKAGFKGSSGY